ncbi:polycystin-1-like protein 1 isoform 4-T4 [Acanthopagrus schlegelii]
MHEIQFGEKKVWQGEFTSSSAASPDTRSRPLGLSAAAPATDREISPWFTGCVSAGSSVLRAPEGARDLDPVACSVRCLDEGFQVAAVSSEGCYCGSRLHGLVSCQCFNTSSSGETKDVTGEERQSVLSLPVGDGRGCVALYRTEGPFLHRVHLSASPHRAQAGQTFVVKVSGNLTGRPDQPTGIPALRRQDFSYVTVEIQETTHKGQSSQRVSVPADGSFVVSSHWILEAPGNYELYVIVSNPLSTLSSTLHLSVFQPPVISVLHGPMGVPSCIPFLPEDSDSVKVEALYLGDPATLQADVADGLVEEFYWCFTHKEKGTNMEDVKTVCTHSSDCVNGTVDWTFEAEGVYMVSVNASGAFGWTEERIHVVVVRPAMSDLRVSVSRRKLTSGECVPVDVELFTTMKHLLVLNLTLTAEHGRIDNTAHIDGDGNYSSEMTQQGNGSDHGCNNRNVSCGHSLNQNHDNVRCHAGTHLYLLSDTYLNIHNRSSCHLNLYLCCCLHPSAGQHHLTASVLSTSDPPSVLLSDTSMLYENICALRPSGSWKSEVSTHVEFSLEVLSNASRVGSRVTWTFSLDDDIVLNRTTEEWSIKASLSLAGCYKVTVEAFNPVSCASFSTHILAQDQVGELALNAQSVIAANQKHTVLFSATAGSNMTLSLLVNAALLYRNSSYTTGEQATVVLHVNHTETVVVELRAENRVSSQKKSLRLCVEGNRKPSPQVRVNPTWQPPTSQSPVHSSADNVRIYAAKQAYPTSTDVTFQAVTDVPDPVEFLWHFGDSTSAQTTSRTVTTRYHKPGRYDVVAVMSSGRTSLTSDVFPLVVQRAVKLNRLIHQPSVPQNQMATVSCRVNVGTDVGFLWSFGDGSSRLGQSTEQHVFHSTGEFTVTVTVSNLVSSASLSSPIFVVDRPCRPPPVKNMGPLKIQVRRYEVIRLGVTYDSEVDCDLSGGLRYTWTLFDSAGRDFPLPLVDTHRQSLVLPGYILRYDTYTARAKVQVVGSVVYSNYSVRVQVIPSPPVAFIQGGTNVFIRSRNTTAVVLDGRRSYDPDFPMSPVSFSWTCKPVSSIASSCFHRDVPTSFPVVAFPATFLRQNFDQFQFTLTIHSGERSASSETFLTLTSNVIGKLSVYCPHCQGEHVNWDQSFSVSASCEGCDIDPDYIQYSWHLFSVNASSKPVIEVPFCYSVDLATPSAVMEGPAASPRTSVTSTHNSSESSVQKLDLNVTGSGTLSENTRKKTTMAGLTEPEPELFSSLAHMRAEGSGEEPFYHPLGEFDPPEPLYSPSEYQPLALDNSGVLYLDHFGQSGVISKFPIDSSADWEFSSPVLESGGSGGRSDLDYDVAWMTAEEGDPGISAGRPTGVDGENLSPGDDLEFEPSLHEDEGSDLVDSRLPVVNQEPILLDLSRDLVDSGLFESYTYTGISSSVLGFRPFSLRPGSRYMLEVTAKSDDSLLGRTQLFLKTNPAPKGMTCQVQPEEGRELYTHFSIFCASGKEDLVYKYSVQAGDRPPRVLYQGRDFEYYFGLPSGDPSDDYKVTVYTEIRSSTYGAATKPCPVTVRVRPSFSRDNSPSSSSSSSSRLDPDLELSESGLRNLSALVQLGNSAEVRNYVSLLTGILNRLSLDAQANTPVQRRTRNVLIRTVCELESREQASMVDNICILKHLLQATSQVTFASARQATLHVQAISDAISESGGPAWYYLDEKTLDTLMALLSYSLQAAVRYNDITPEMSKSADVKLALDSDSREENSGVYIRKGGLVSKQVVQLVADTLQTASDMMLKYILFHKAQEHRVNNGFIALYATYQNQTSTVISSGSAAFHMPASLIQRLFGRHSGGTESRRHRPPCVLGVLTELTHSPYTWAHYPRRLSGPVIDLSLYECSARRKIAVRSLVQPVNVEMQQPARNKSSAHEYVLQRSGVNYHSFNITQEHLQQAIQLSVAFTPPLSKPFPILLLFRMFERPTPSMHHLHRIHRWESDTTQFTLPSSYLSGVAHLAVLNADFEKAPRHKHLSGEVSYTLTVESSLCLSWDDHRGAWTHHGCRTQRADATAAVSCSCHQLRPLTVAQHRIHSSHDATDLDPFLSVTRDLTVLGVLVLCVCLFIPGLVACKKADVMAKANRRVHYLSDNSQCDPYLYAVTVHTGPCSAACMSAKVYIALNGEDGVSQTKELQVPGCTLFRRNSHDTFIFSAADSLGPVWGVHIWHDNSGPSPDWYLNQVEVSELSRGHVRGRAWLFVGRCWLAVIKGDGQVERRLRVCTRGIGFAKMLSLKLLDYLADHHSWISLLSCPCHHSFTHTQRLGVNLLLLLGYACVNAAIVSRMDDQLPFELGFTDVSAVSVTAGVLSVLAVLPAAGIISFLFRLRDVELARSGVRQVTGRKTEKATLEDALSVSDSTSEPHLFWSSLQWAQDTWRRKYQGMDVLSASTTIVGKNTDIEPVIQTDVIVRREAVEDNTGRALQNFLLITEGNSVHRAPEGNESDILSERSSFYGARKAFLSGAREGGQAVQMKEDPQGKRNEGRHHQAAWPSHSSHHIADRLKRRGLRPVSQWCHYMAWTLCLLLSLCCLLLSAVLGMRFSSSKVLLWIHSLLISLMSCIFLIQPAVIITVAVTISLWYGKRADFHSFSTLRDFETETLQLWTHDGAIQPDGTPVFSQERCSHLKTLLRARQRARYLRLVRPPTAAELRVARGKKRREALLHKTLRDLSVCGSMLLLMLCINYGSSFSDHYHLNKAVRRQFVRGHDNAFMSIQNRNEWWKWAQTSLLNSLYKNASAAPESHILIGEPILWKAEVSSSFQGQVSSVTTHPQSSVFIPTAAPPETCGHLGCYLGPGATVGLSRTKSHAASKLKLLHSDGWLGRRTVALKVQFTLFSPAPNLFTSVTLLAEQSPAGILLPSAKVQSVRVYRTPAVWDYAVMVCQLIFLLLSLLQLWDQMYTVGQQGLMGYWRKPCNWLEVSLLAVILVYYVYYIYHSVILLEVAELLQRDNHRGHVDVGVLATWEQCVLTLRGVTLFLLTVKCATVLRVSRTLAASATLLTRSLSSLFWPMVSGLILLVALSCMGNLLFIQSSGAFSSLPRSLQTLLCHRWSPRAVRGPHVSWSDFLYHGVLCLSFTVAWTAVVKVVASSSIRRAKRSQNRQNAFTAAELVGYVGRSVSDFTGQRRKARTDNRVEGKMYYLEEFESLVDELLFRLNTFSNSLHRIPPYKAHRYREDDGSVISPREEPSDLDTQDFIRARMTEERKSDLTDVSGHGKTLSASLLIRSKLEMEMVQSLQKRRQSGHTSSSDIVVASDNSQQPRTRAEENLKDDELQSYSGAENCLSVTECGSLIKDWKEDALEKKDDEWTTTNDNSSLSKSQATHSEVVVEVLVHEEPESVAR